MPYLLNLAYLAILALVWPLLLYAAVRKGKYREGWGAKLFGWLPRRESTRSCVWLHAVSVGEVNLLQPLIDEWTRRFPDWDVVVSTTTRTGYRLAKQKYAPRTVFYCPLDFTWAVHSALRRIRPRLLVLAELELWPNLIWAARSQGAAVAVVNGRLSTSSARGYGRVRWLFRRLFRSIDLIAAQNDEYAQRFLQLGASPNTVCVTGSMKFDGAEANRQNPRTMELTRLANISPQHIVFLAGSTQAPEESLALAAFQAAQTDFPQLRLVLVPRHPERFDEVARLLDQSGMSWRRRSQLPAADALGGASVLLVDAVGELGAWWGRADIGFVGGSMGTRGGQNMIEPSAYGVATCFGPKTSNFRDVVSLLMAKHAAVIVSDGKELSRFLRQCLEQPKFARELADRATEVTREHVGATSRTVDLLSGLLVQTSSRRVLVGPHLVPPPNLPGRPGGVLVRSPHKRL